MVNLIIELVLSQNNIVISIKSMIEETSLNETFSKTQSTKKLITTLKYVFELCELNKKPRIDYKYIITIEKFKRLFRS